MTPAAVVVYGTVALDRFLAVDPSGEPIPPARWEEKPGGEALNTALALTGWGVSVALVGTATGADPVGETLRALLDQNGISRAGIPLDPSATTPCCDIRVFPDGERVMSGKGFAQAVAPAVPRALFATQPLVVVDPNLGNHAIATALAAVDAGCRLVAMDFAHVPAVVERADVVQVSLESLRRWGGGSGAPAEVASALHRRGAKLAVVTCGAHGGFVADAEGTRPFSAVPLTGVRDTTGAGDCFRAGLCYGLLQRWPVPETIDFARTAAACHCCHWGASARLPLEEVEAQLPKK